MAMRAALRAEPEMARNALARLAGSMQTYLRVQAAAGAEVVQLFDTWAGLLDRATFQEYAVPAARASLDDVGVPTIYFAPGAGHTLDAQLAIGAVGYGVDWRVPLAEAFDRLPERAIQGNLDPSVLRSDPGVITNEVKQALSSVGGRPGHIMNLGHGIDRRTPPENVAAFVEAVRS
jgi:uroporphyrinogen decarboxylase